MGRLRGHGARLMVRLHFHQNGVPLFFQGQLSDQVETTSHESPSVQRAAKNLNNCDGFIRLRFYFLWATIPYQLGCIDNHGSHSVRDASMTIPKKLQLLRSYRVATLRNCLSLENILSILFRSLYTERLKSLCFVRFLLGGITASEPFSLIACTMESVS